MKNFWKILNLFCIGYGILGIVCLILGEIKVFQGIWMILIGLAGFIFYEK